MIAAALFSFLAIILLAFKIPGALQNPCESCVEGNTLLPLLGAAYFTALFTAILLYPERFGKTVSRAGLVWAIMLGSALTLTSDALCPICLAVHCSHVLAWASLVLSQARQSHLKCFYLLFTPLLTAALFLGLNLALAHRVDSIIGMNVSHLGFKDYEETKILFAGPNCPFCKAIYPKLEKEPIHNRRLIAITRKESPEMKGSLPSYEWIEDPEGKLIKALKIQGFPTLVTINRSGKVISVKVGGDI